MKKLLILILIVLLLALTIFIMISGFSIGNIDILGIKGIQNASANLDSKIQEASKLAETDYKKAINDVEDSAKKLEQTKQEYDEMTANNPDADTQIINQMQKYNIESLWVKLGNHAKSEGVTMKMDVSAGNSAGLTDKDDYRYYDLNFTVNGSYISIVDFISDIENDSTLGFKIEQFKMSPGSSTSNLQSTFVCKNIAINNEGFEATAVTTDSEENTTDENATDGNTTDENTTNTTNTTSDSNTDSSDGSVTVRTN